MHAGQVFGYCMFKGGEEAKVGYPTEGFEGDVAGRSFHNGRFVQRLRQAAAGAPGVTLRQGTVRRLLAGAHLMQQPKPNPESYALCSACGSLPRARPAPP